MFSKNEGGDRLTAKNNRFRSLLIWLLSVASISRKFLKTIHTDEHSVHANSDSFFSTHSYLVVISFYFYDLILHLFLFQGFLTMKTTFSCFPVMFKNPAPAKYFLKKSKILWNINFIRISRKIIDDYYF